MTELRIMGGKFKGKNLKVPFVSHPVTTRVKATIFDTLMNKIENSRVLDLFAGSGNLGIEALSRGASWAVFIEHNKEAVKIINENLKKLDADGETILSDYKIFLKRNSEKFDLIFIDPPFDFIPNLKLKAISKNLNAEGIVILKTAKQSYIKIPEDLEILFEKTLGENKIYFLSLNN